MLRETGHYSNLPAWSGDLSWPLHVSLQFMVHCTRGLQRGEAVFTQLCFYLILLHYA